MNSTLSLLKQEKIRKSNKESGLIIAEYSQFSILVNYRPRGRVVRVTDCEVLTCNLPSGNSIVLSNACKVRNR